VTGDHCLPALYLYARPSVSYFTCSQGPGSGVTLRDVLRRNRRPWVTAGPLELARAGQPPCSLSSHCTPRRAIGNSRRTGASGDREVDAVGMVGAQHLAGAGRPSTNPPSASLLHDLNPQGLHDSRRPAVASIPWTVAAAVVCRTSIARDSSRRAFIAYHEPHPPHVCYLAAARRFLEPGGSSRPCAYAWHAVHLTLPWPRRNPHLLPSTTSGAISGTPPRR